MGKRFRAQVVRSGKNFDGKYSRLKWDNIWKAPRPKPRPEVPEVEEDDEPAPPDICRAPAGVRAARHSDAGPRLGTAPSPGSRCDTRETAG